MCLLGSFWPLLRRTLVSSSWGFLESESRGPSTRNTLSCFPNLKSSNVEKFRIFQNYKWIAQFMSCVTFAHAGLRDGKALGDFLIDRFPLGATREKRTPCLNAQKKMFLCQKCFRLLFFFPPSFSALSASACSIKWAIESNPVWFLSVTIITLSLKNRN